VSALKAERNALALVDNQLIPAGFLSMLSFTLKIAAGSQLEKATVTTQMIRACRGIVPKRIVEAAN
jgi:hypothetical protein